MFGVGIFLWGNTYWKGGGLPPQKGVIKDIPECIGVEILITKPEEKVPDSGDHFRCLGIVGHTSVTH